MGDLPGKIGVSRRTLFECRSADSAVSRKTWLKLEAAERAAGLFSALQEGAADGPAEDEPTAVRERKVKYLTGAAAKKPAMDYEAAFWQAAERLPATELMDMAEDLQTRKPPGYDAVLDLLLPLLKSRMAGLDSAPEKHNISPPPPTP